MTEDEGDNSKLSELLIDENNNDLQKNVYEGGSKVGNVHMILLINYHI